MCDDSSTWESEYESESDSSELLEPSSELVSTQVSFPCGIPIVYKTDSKHNNGMLMNRL
jgi:hypothetical protein